MKTRIRKHVETAAQVIDALGGTAAVAMRFGETYNAVWNWRVRGLPTDTYIAFMRLLGEKRIAAPPELWGMRRLPR